MAMTALQRYELKKFIKEIASYRARHTELVTVYIPTGYDMNKIITHLSQEQGTAQNIKSSATRKNVTDALEKMIQHLRIFKRTPPHGLAVFSGNVAEREGQQNFLVKSIEPPTPLNTRIYRCDKSFQLDLVRDMLETKEIYGLIVMDRRECTIAELRGKAINVVASGKSNVPGKTRAGGQSSARFMRIREDAAKDFYKKVASLIKDKFFEKKDTLKGLIIGGPGPTKHELVDGNYITADLKKKIIAVKDISYTDEFGLQELLEKSQDVLAAEEIADEKKVMNEFFNLLAKTEKKVTYGKDETMKILEMGAIDKLLLSEELDEKDIELFEEKSKEVGTEVIIISTQTREGVQLKELGMVAAILRFEVQS